MQNIDEILPVILHTAILKRPPFFCFLRYRPTFWCVTLFWVVLWVCKRNWAKTFFYLEIMGWAYMPTPAWNKLYQSLRGIGLNTMNSLFPSPLRNCMLYYVSYNVSYNLFYNLFIHNINFCIILIFYFLVSFSLYSSYIFHFLCTFFFLVFSLKFCSIFCYSNIFLFLILSLA